MSHQLTARRLLAPLALVSVSLALSLSSCSSESEKTEPAASASPDISSATTTEDIEDSVMPEYLAAMKTYDKNAAVVTTDYFLHLTIHGLVTNDWHEYNILSAPSCKFCTSFRSDNQKKWKKVSSKTTPTMAIKDVAVGRKEDNPNHWRVNLVATRDPYTITYKNGEVEDVEAETTGFTFLLDSSNGWKVLTAETFEAELFYELYPEAH